jgi:hypothetical protein
MCLDVASVEPELAVTPIGTTHPFPTPIALGNLYPEAILNRRTHSPTASPRLAAMSSSSRVT